MYWLVTKFNNYLTKNYCSIFLEKKNNYLCKKCKKDTENLMIELIKKELIYFDYIKTNNYKINKNIFIDYIIKKYFDFNYINLIYILLCLNNYLKSIKLYNNFNNLILNKIIIFLGNINIFNNEQIIYHKKLKMIYFEIIHHNGSWYKPLIEYNTFKFL